MILSWVDDNFVKKYIKEASVMDVITIRFRDKGNEWIEKRNILMMVNIHMILNI